MGGVIIIAFINILLVILLIKSIYNALRHKKGLIFKISYGIKKYALRMYAVATKNPTRKYGALFLIVGVIIIYTLHQTGVIGMQLLE